MMTESSRAQQQQTTTAAAMMLVAEAEKECDTTTTATVTSSAMVSGDSSSELLVNDDSALMEAEILKGKKGVLLVQDISSEEGNDQEDAGSSGFGTKTDVLDINNEEGTTVGGTAVEAGPMKTYLNLTRSQFSTQTEFSNIRLMQHIVQERLAQPDGETEDTTERTAEEHKEFGDTSPAIPEQEDDGGCEPKGQSIHESNNECTGIDQDSNNLQKGKITADTTDLKISQISQVLTYNQLMELAATKQADFLRKDATQGTERQLQQNQPLVADTISLLPSETMAGLNLPPQLSRQAATHPPSSPGAIFVAGVDFHAASEEATLVFGGYDDDDETDGQARSPDPEMQEPGQGSMPSRRASARRSSEILPFGSEHFEPEDPIEATLVNGNSSAEFVEAQSLQIQFKDALQNRKMCSVLAIMCLLVILASGLAVGLVVDKQSKSSADDTSDGDSSPDDAEMEPSMLSTTVPFIDDLDGYSMDKITTDPSSPHARANVWMLEDPNLDQYSLERKLARFFLATFYLATNGPEWHRNDHWLDYVTHECDWYMPHPGNAVCNDMGEHVILNLTSNALDGTLIPNMGLYIPHLHTIDLSNNTMKGPVPTVSRGGLQIVHMDLSKNSFLGKMSAEPGYITYDMIVLRVHDNQLFGNLPEMLAICPNLEELDVSNNQLEGTVPSNFATNSSHVRVLNVANNLLEGTLPTTMGRLVGLHHFNVSGNQALTGTIPIEVSLLQELKTMDISNTSLKGNVPDEVCALEESGDLIFLADCDKLQCC